MSDKIIQLNEDLIKHDLKDLVRSSVEETLNALLDKEADELVNAENMSAPLGIFRGRGSYRDVSGRCICPACGGYHRGFMGNESIPRNHQQPE